MVTPVAQYCVASHDTFTSDDNIWNILEVLKIK